MKEKENRLWKLFITTFTLSAFTFGGGFVIVSLYKKKFVEELGWLEEDEMLDITAIAQSSPGPISINSATFVGQRVYGTLGAVVCSIAAVLPAFFICLTLAYFYYKYKNFAGVQTVLAALRPAVIALIASAGVSILVLALFNSSFNTITLTDFRWLEFGLFLSGFYILRKFKANAVSIIIGTGVVGTLLQVMLNTI